MSRLGGAKHGGYYALIVASSLLPACASAPIALDSADKSDRTVVDVTRSAAPTVKRPPELPPALQNLCWSLEECTAACDAGNGEACHREARLINSTGRNDAAAERAALLETRACENGSWMACNVLALRQSDMIMKNLDKPDVFHRALREQDDLKARAIELAKAACDSGDAHACYDWGYDHETPIPPPSTSFRVPPRGAQQSVNAFAP
jgi:hypothetical protein